MGQPSSLYVGREVGCRFLYVGHFVGFFVGFNAGFFVGFFVVGTLVGLRLLLCLACFDSSPSIPGQYEMKMVISIGDSVICIAGKFK